MDERIEELIFCREASIEDKSFFLFKNTKGEYRVVEAKAYESFRFQPGMVVTAKLRKKGCTGEEICELTRPGLQRR